MDGSQEGLRLGISNTIGSLMLMSRRVILSRPGNHGGQTDRKQLFTAFRQLHRLGDSLVAFMAILRTTGLDEGQGSRRVLAEVLS